MRKTDKTTLQGAASKPLRTRNRESKFFDIPAVFRNALYREMFNNPEPFKAAVWHIAMDKPKPRLYGLDVPYIIVDEITPFERVVDKDSPNFPFS